MSRFCVSWVLLHGGIRFLEDIIITAKNVCYVNKEQQSQHDTKKVCFTHVWDLLHTPVWERATSASELSS